MIGQLVRKEPANLNKISLAESWEVSYWAKKLKVTEIKLHEAVGAVGHSTERVRKWLKTH